MVPGWKAWILLAVLVMHTLAALALYGYRPDRSEPRVLPRATLHSDELLMVLSFPAPRRTEKNPIATSTLRPNAALASIRQRGSGLIGAAAESNESTGQSLTAPLELSLPPPQITLPPRKDFLAHKAAIGYQATRYERAWLSEGNLTHVLARHSIVAATLLGALGALKEPCSESDRRNYKAGCVPDQYEFKAEELDE